MAVDTKELKSDNLTVNIKFEPGCRATFDIQVTPQGAEAAYRKAIKVINKEVSLPGFRKGKAPEAIITQNYGKHVEREWKDILLQTAFSEALELANLYPLTKESVKNSKVPNASRETGAEVHFEMEVYPTIPTIDPAEFRPDPIAQKEITEKDINDSLENIQYQQAKWNVIEDRPLQDGDFALLDIVNLDEPDTPFICQDMRFEVLEGKMGDWMRKLVTGLNVGDSVEGVSEKDEKLEAEEEEFTPTKCKITVKGIQTVELPELNEEFVKKFGCENLEELKKRIEEDLNRQAEELVKTQYRGQLTKFLLEKYPFEIPQSMLEREIKNRSTGEEEDKEKVAEEALNSLRIFFLIRTLADKNKIEVTEQEYMRELTRQLQSGQGFLHSNMDPDQARSQLYLRVLEQKTQDFLIDQAKAVDNAA